MKWGYWGVGLKKVGAENERELLKSVFYDGDECLGVFSTLPKSIG